jgi:hypothetical protein
LLYQRIRGARASKISTSLVNVWLQNVWRLLDGNGLWIKVIQHKYIKPESVEEWVRNPVKKWKNASIIWKAMVIVFPLIVKNLIWKVGKGSKVQIGLDPWVGSGESFRLSEALIDKLHIIGFFVLSQVANLDFTTIWRQEWMEADMLGLDGEDAVEWGQYINALWVSHQ